MKEYSKEELRELIKESVAVDNIKAAVHFTYTLGSIIQKEKEERKLNKGK